MSDAGAKVESKRSARRFITLFLVVNGVAYLLWLFSAVQEDRVARTRSAMHSVNPPAGDGDLRIDAWTNASHVTTKDALSFWIAIHNPSRTPVHDLRFITFDHNLGFEVPRLGDDAACWKDGKPMCTAVSSQLVRPSAWPRKLGGGETVTVVGRLKANDESGLWTVNAVIAWTDPCSAGGLLRKPVNLGPVTVESPLRKWLLLALKSLQNYIKDLALPIGLALFAFWGKWQEDKREERTRAEESQRESTRAADQEKRAHVNEAWMLMLPKTHERNEIYYMPISHSASKVRGYYAAIGSREFAADQCFFFFWLLHRQMNDFANEVGGWYLKNRRGEEMVSATWSCIIEWTDAVTGRAMREEAISLMSRNMSFKNFRDRVAWREPFPELRRIFDAQLSDAVPFENLIAVFHLFETVLDFEMNRAYEHWYSVDDMLPFPESFTQIVTRFRETRHRMVAPLHEESLAQLDLEIDRYLSHVDKARKLLHSPAEVTHGQEDRSLTSPR